MLQEERNAFISQNYQAVCGLCLKTALKIHRKFSRATVEDLQAYAMQGVIEALDRADRNHPGLWGFLSKYCFSYTVQGVGLLLGLPHWNRKSSHIELQKSVRLIAYTPQKIALFVEKRQPPPLESQLDKVIAKDTLRALKGKLQGSYEGLVLSSLVSGMTLTDMERCYQFTTRRVYRYAKRLKDASDGLRNGTTIKAHITPIRQIHFHYHFRVMPPKRRRMLSAHTMIVHFRMGKRYKPCRGQFERNWLRLASPAMREIFNKPVRRPVFSKVHRSF